MKFIFLILCVLVCVTPANLLAGEVLLPGLVGDYTSGMGVSVAVNFGEPIADLARVSLELTGIVNSSWIIVGTDTLAWGGEFAASFSESDPGFWLSSTSMNNLMDETFYSLTSFFSLFSANSDFLNDGQAEMYFEFSPLAFVGGIDEVGPSPIGSIQSARLVFEETVAIEAASWGHVKSLFGAF